MQKVGTTDILYNLFDVAVQDAVQRFVEVATISQHQRCLLIDSYQTIKMLKGDLVESQ